MYTPKSPRFKPLLDDGKTYFWYISSMSADAAYLLDLIRRPTKLELRLVLYIFDHGNWNVSIHKQYFPLTMFNITKSSVTVGTMKLLYADSLTLTAVGTVNEISVNCKATSLTREMDFLPAWAKKRIL